MGNKQGKNKKKNKVTKEDEALLDLKLKLRKIREYQKKIEKVVEREVEIAKTCLKNGKKAQALRALKAKKLQEDMLTKSESMYDNLSTMVTEIEQKQQERDVFEGLKIGNDMLKQLQKEMSLEDVEKLMDETQEAIEYQQQIDDAMSNRIGVEQEDEIEKELDDIIAAQADAATVKMPTVPTTVPEGQQEAAGVVSEDEEPETEKPVKQKKRAMATA